jgi:hypothetical protein
MYARSVASPCFLRRAVGIAAAAATLFLAAPAQPESACVEYHDRGHVRAALPLSVDELSRLTRAGQHAYLSTGSEVHVLDVSNPDAPVDVTTIAVPEPVADLHAHAGSLYLATAGGLRVYSVADPALPVPGTTLALPGSPHRLAARGNTVLVTALTGGLHVVDVTSPGAPALLATVPATSTTYDVGFHGTGATAFVIDGGSLRVVDVSTPAAPTVPWTTLQGSFAGIVGETMACVRAQAGATYLVNVWDLSSPTAPVFASSFEGTFESGVVDGGVALLAYSGAVGGEVRSYDVDDPVNPALQGLLRPYGGQDVVRTGDTVLLASRAGGLVVLDVSDPTTTLAEYETQSMAVTRMQLLDQRLHVIGRSGLCSTARYSILDGNNLSTSLPLGSASLTNGTTAFHTDGTLAVAVESIGSGLFVLDVSVPTAPTQVAQIYPGPESDVRIEGTHAYTTSPSGLLRVFDLAVPSSPTLVGSVATPGAGGSLGSVPGYLLMTDPVAGLRVYSLADPEAPVEVASGIVPDGTHAIHVPDPMAGWAALKNTTTGKIYGVGLADPENPVFFGETDALPGGGAMAVQGGQLYALADSSPWVRFFQVFDLGGSAWSVPAPPLLETVSYQGVLEFGVAWANDIAALDDGVLLGRFFSHDDFCGDTPGVNHVGYLSVFPSHCASSTAVPAVTSAARVTGARPNPFATSTAIRFDASRSGVTHVSIYDAAGRRIRDLGRFAVGAGSHERTWDGRDDGGRAVTAGVYFVRVEGPDGAATEKVVRMR